ncbi:MAG TPA: 3-phosphoshikimate 1-carboxyvinyltransferase, partial [Sphingomonadales bacterium]|nr:3-phosphoshikimate 1-carboxyvinyltransferase [Sphingomonadales bacterium]
RPRPHRRKAMATLISRKGKPLKGRVRVPGDKSISHRALILAALAAGRSRLAGVSGGEDVARTKAALGALGVTIREGEGETLVQGAGLGGLQPPHGVLDFGNAGTGARLLMGALAAHKISAAFTGDESLRRRPMGALLLPLIRMGARVSPGDATTLPFTLHGTAETVPGVHTLSAPSAQVKSAILLAGLNTMGTTTVIEKIPTRDHTEILLRQFGAAVRKEKAGRGRRISISGWRELRPRGISIPGDISAAAFPLAAALLVPGSDVRIENVGLNPARTGFLKVLKRMGARLAITNRRTASGEARGTIRAQFSRLRAITTPRNEAVALIDEFPILFVLAAAAKGTSRFRALSALRTKESDRLEGFARVLVANGIKARVSGDAMIITGRPAVPGGALIDAGHDHRVAMAMGVLGLTAEKPVRVTGAETLATSFPGFVKVMRALGAAITLGGESAA